MMPSAKHWYPGIVDRRKIYPVLSRVGRPGVRNRFPFTLSPADAFRLASHAALTRDSSAERFISTRWQPL
jgi:hypothetical protein